MIRKAKIFTSGNSQAVRLPKEFQVTDAELKIQRVGKSIILSPVNDPWDGFRSSLKQFSDDFMQDGRNQPMLTESDAKNVFD